MTRLEAIDALLTRVKAGEWCELSAIKIWPQGRVVDNEWLHEFSLAQRSYNGSLDAAKALHEAVLPGWGHMVGPHYTSVLDPGPIHGMPRKDKDGLSQGRPARAWLIAILKALKAQEEEDV